LNVVEQPETLPARSVAVALKAVVESAGTLTVRPAAPNPAAVPVCTGVPVQVPPA
jgi:hypothetical protein